mmetsp:Transcript_50039/g.161966  ORF Transcript_50039/g.161966 Transcript_50039/m.161966 type:complete len:215 (+) Transcript_50039:2198-2842(+)
MSSTPLMVSFMLLWNSTFTSPLNSGCSPCHCLVSVRTSKLCEWPPCVRMSFGCCGFTSPFVNFARNPRMKGGSVVPITITCPVSVKKVPVGDFLSFFFFFFLSSEDDESALELPLPEEDDDDDEPLRFRFFFAAFSARLAISTTAAASRFRSRCAARMEASCMKKGTSSSELSSPFINRFSCISSFFCCFLKFLARFLSSFLECFFSCSSLSDS